MLRPFARALDWVYAPTCAACDETIAAERALCPVCQVSLLAAGPKSPPRPFLSLAAPYLYGGQLAVALRRLKFDGRRDVARTLAPLVGPALAAAAARADVLIAVPLHRSRLSQRGYNQSALLVRHARQYTGLPVDRLSLRRTLATRPQTGLSWFARRANVDGAFAVAPRRQARVAGARVLLFDDIVTTGATLAAAARALLEAGARAVRGFCPARTESL